MTCFYARCDFKTCVSRSERSQLNFQYALNSHASSATSPNHIILTSFVELLVLLLVKFTVSVRFTFLSFLFVLVIFM